MTLDQSFIISIVISYHNDIDDVMTNIQPDDCCERTDDTAFYLYAGLCVKCAMRWLPCQIRGENIFLNSVLGYKKVEHYLLC